MRITQRQIHLGPFMLMTLGALVLSRLATDAAQRIAAANAHAETALRLSEQRDAVRLTSRSLLI